MRYIYFLFLALCLSACGDDFPDPVFTIKRDAQVSIPANLNTIETHSFFIRNHPIFLESQLRDNNMTLEDVAQILPANCRITARSGIDLAFINSISLHAWSRSELGQRSEMFYRENIPFNEGGEIQLLASIANLKDIMQSGSYDLEVRIDLRSFSPSSFILEMDYEIGVYDQ